MVSLIAQAAQSPVSLPFPVVPYEEGISARVGNEFVFIGHCSCGNSGPILCAHRVAAMVTGAVTPGTMQDEWKASFGEKTLGEAVAEVAELIRYNRRLEQEGPVAMECDLLAP